MKNNRRIELTRQGRVAVLDLDGRFQTPQDLTEFFEDLTQVCREVADNGDIAVVVINPEAKPFPSACGDADEAWRWCPAAGDAPGHPVDALSALPQPVLLGLDGDILDMGLELALACDFRVAADTARMGLTCLDRGMLPFRGGAQRLSRLVGKGHALNMILTAAVIDAREALRIGLVNRVVSNGGVDRVLMETARNMASKGPLALQYAKEAINSGMDMSLEQGLRLEADLYFLLHTSRDRTEGIEAFQQKRKARFEGA